MTIPVFKIRSDSSESERRTFPQHVVRMAGYCHLIATCEGRECPAGIVLFGDSYQGQTVPNSPHAKTALTTALATAREVLQNPQGHPALIQAPASAVCSGCPWGHPRRFRQGRSEFELAGELLPVFGAVAPDQQLYHSSCGDCFAWIPPHEVAMRLGIV
jgi:hypothetical protein